MATVGVKGLRVVTGEKLCCCFVYLRPSVPVVFRWSS